ncbi:hypothetical protein AB0I28_12315 [Phytomonospora sp. NPDC050363]|uniref:hypothetical protein n=1 Tax=Phytomonospora sp. NPDC050363 TaxID=3155642 RepID=UPI0033CE802C
MTAPSTANEVVLQLASLSRELDTTVSQLEKADLDSVDKRSTFDIAFSRAFLEATGAMDIRKHTAVIETAQERVNADVADALVRHLRRRIDAIKTRIEVGRSYSAAIRAELSLNGVHQT